MGCYQDISSRYPRGLLYNIHFIKDLEELYICSQAMVKGPQLQNPSTLAPSSA